MKTLSLRALGWSDFFQSSLDNVRIPGIEPARVTTENKTNFGIRTAEGDRIAEVTGRLFFSSSEEELPKVGDWVAVTLTGDDRAVIHDILPRRTVLSRKAAGRAAREQVIAANIDALFIVQGLDNNYSISRIARYITALQNIIPVVVLNKADLCENPWEKAEEVRQRVPGVAVVLTSAEDLQIEALAASVKPGMTFAFAGSSGVGKSSLINALLSDRKLKTTAVREKDSRGRHTTTRREMIFMENGGILIDTPGMREFQPWADEHDLMAAFADIEELSANCRFSDCQHLHETGCAVKKAVECGLLSSGHYNNYLKLVREMEYQESLVDVNKAQERKKKAKQLIKSFNKVARSKRKRGDPW